MRLPDVYIIGAQKSGTTTLYDWLAQHPQVYGDPLAKDFPFFSQESLYTKGPKKLARFSKGAKPGQLILGGDANAMFVKNAGEKLDKVIPNAKLIAILRNPVDRAYSAYCHAFERCLEDRSFEKAIKDELNGCSYSLKESMIKDYIKHGFYAQQLKSILQYYPREQLFVIIFEEWKENPHKVMREVFRFIGIDPNFMPVMRVKNVTKGRSRSRLIAKIIHWQAPENFIGDFLKFIIPFRLRTLLRLKLSKINRKKMATPNFSKEVHILLKNCYINEIKELEKILNKLLYELWQ